MKKEKLEKVLQEWLNEKDALGRLCIKSGVDKEDFIEFAKEKGYYIEGRMTAKTCIKRKEAINDYLSSDISFTAVCKKYNLDPIAMKSIMINNNLLKSEIKTITKGEYDIHVFDEIDSEDKAYWLGFWFADGYLNSSSLFDHKKADYTIELSLQLNDLEHLNKFKTFIKYSKEIKTDDYRCRFYVHNKHLWTTLASYGCTPLKSLILSFPNENIFKSKDLIRHFIRGYWDGDGWISYSTADHQIMHCGVLGTIGFLTCIKNYLNIDNKLQHNHENEEETTMKFTVSGKNALGVLNYLYDNATIYLERKYAKYKELCRLYEKSYRLLEGNIGEGCDANTEINSEITKGSESS